MSLFVPRRQYDPDLPEMMDRPDVDPDLLGEDLRNIRVINRLFGGLRTMRRCLVPLIACVPADRVVSILDIATGSGDHPIEISRIMQHSGRDAHITAVDINPFMVETAREHAAAYGNIAVEQADALNLSYGDSSFDIVLCSLAIHHFSRADAVRLLSEMNRLCHAGFIVNDLNRSRIGSWIVWLYSHAVTRNPITRYDACASMRRAFTRRELAAMAREAGVKVFTTSTAPFFRLALVAQRR